MKKHRRAAFLLALLIPLAALAREVNITTGVGEVSATNPLPAQLSVGGAAGSAANPLPAQLSQGGAVLTAANPLPGQLSQGGVVISDTNPLSAVRVGSPLDICHGSISGRSCIHKFGRNASVGTTAEFINDLSTTTYSWPTGAEPIRVKVGGNAADDQDGGAGCRSVTISGLDETWAAASETEDTEGAAISTATTTTFIRVFRAFCASSGTYAGPVGNTAAIVLENTSSTNDLATITATLGQTTMTQYTIPTGKTGYLLSWGGSVDSAKPASFQIFQRTDADDTSVPVASRRLVDQIFGVPEGPFRVQLDSYPQFAARTDVWMMAKADSATTSVSGTFCLLLIDD